MRKGRLILDIKLATINDVAIIHDLMMRAFSEYKTMAASSTALDETIETITAGVLGGEQAMICYMEDTPCAAVRFELKEDALYFFRLSVAPEFQRRGLARALLEAMESHALELGLSKVQCRVRMNLEKNMQLYLSAGYKQYNQSIFEIDGFELDVAWMEKELVSTKPKTGHLPAMNA